MFKKIIINQHEKTCTDNENHFFGGFSNRTLCELNMEKFLFQHETNFFLVLIPRCGLNDRKDFAKNLIEQIIDNSKKERYYALVQKSITDKDLQNFRIRGIELEKWINQVHYIYENAVKNFYITSQVDFLENWQSGWNDKLTDSYHQAKGNIDCPYLLKKLDELYKANLIKELYTPVEVFKTIDFMAKKMRQTIKKQKA